MPAVPRKVAPSLQSWLILQENPQDPLECGGLCRIYVANSALNVGDAVWFFGTVAGVGPSVDKSAVTANHILVAGVVVGGQRLGVPGRGDTPFVTNDPNDVGTLAAGAGEFVVVCYSGVCFVVADAAMAVVGTPIAPSTTVAGRARPAVNGTGADDAKRMGKILEAAAGAASVIHALINVD